MQDVSTTGLTMPIIAIFTDPAEADKFIESLRIPGVGALVHPVKGLKYVMPLGEVKQKDALVSNVNQVSVKVVFVETIPDVYTGAETPKSEALKAIALFDSTLEEDLSTTDPPSIGAVKEATQTVRGVTKKIAEVEADVARVTAAITNEINNTLNTFVGDPVSLFFQAAQLVRMPAQVVGLTADKLEAYKNLIVDTAANLWDYKPDKDFAAGIAMESVAASVESVLVATDFVTAAEATGSAEKVLASFDRATAFAEDNGGLGQSWWHLYQAVSLVVGHLIRLSFTLLQEREYIVPRDMTLLEAVAATYGTDNLEKNLDFLVGSNYLTGSEILTIPKGKVLKIYE